MENNVTTIKAFLIALIAAGTAIWGWMGWLIILWVVCMVLDFATGCMAASRNHEWNSSRAREGLWGKAGMIVAVIEVPYALYYGDSLRRTFGYPMPVIAIDGVANTVMAVAETLDREG